MKTPGIEPATFWLVDSTNCATACHQGKRKPEFKRANVVKKKRRLWK
jgi:hypothetical protein